MPTCSYPDLSWLCHQGGIAFLLWCAQQVSSQHFWVVSFLFIIYVEHRAIGSRWPPWLSLSSLMKGVHNNHNRQHHALHKESEWSMQLSRGMGSRSMVIKYKKKQDIRPVPLQTSWRCTHCYNTTNFMHSKVIMKVEIHRWSGKLQSVLTLIVFDFPVISSTFFLI